MAFSNFTISSSLLPYDPNDVDIRQQTMSIGMVTEMMKLGEIELWRPNDFQRLGGLWSPGEKSRLIESLLMRIPLPIFYLDGSLRPWKIIDGLQRLTVLDEFINRNSFELTELEYVKEIEGLRFNDLSFSYKRTIMNFFIEAYIINPGTPDNVKFNIFQRINTTGIKLNAQELRNAYYSGDSAIFINRLAESQAFKLTVGDMLSKKRMKDREFALRFVAFYLFQEEFSPPMDRFLDFSMQYIADLSEDAKEDIYLRFTRALSTCFSIFGNNSFFVLNVNGAALTNSPNIAIFESWVVNLAKRDIKTHKALIRNRDIVVRRFAEYLQQKDFYRSVVSATTKPSGVELRFSMISDLIDISI